MRATDWVLLSALGALFLVSLVLHLRAVARTGLGGPGILVTAPGSADDYPRIAPSPPRPYDRTDELPIGARVLRAGDTDVRGMGELRFYAAALEAVANERVVFWIDRGAGPDPLERACPPNLPFWWWYLPTSLSFALLGVIAIFRIPDRRLARYSFAGPMLFAAVWLRFYGGSRELTYAWVAASAVETALFMPLSLRAMLLFPADTARDGPVARWAPWGFVAL